MTTKPPRTRTAQIRCQPCHYDQILKAATMERDRLEDKETDKDRIEIIQIGSRAISKYIRFFNEFPNFPFSSNFKTIARENPTIREMKVKQIERFIIERGV